MLLLGAALLLLWAWRANFGLAPQPSPALRLSLVFIEVAGQVQRPGVHAFDHSPTLPDVWLRAGGPTPIPHLDEKLASGSKVTVSQGGRYQLGRMSGGQLLTLGLTIDLNQASQEDLEALPGIGPALAARVLEHRRQHGPFKRLEDLEQVSGIGPKKLAQITPFLVVQGQESPDIGGE